MLPIKLRDGVKYAVKVWSLPVNSTHAFKKLQLAAKLANIGIMPRTHPCVTYAPDADHYVNTRKAAKLRRDPKHHAEYLRRLDETETRDTARRSEKRRRQLDVEVARRVKSQGR